MSTQHNVWGVAWDVDGTLIDSEPLHLRSLQRLCAVQGVDLSDFGPSPFAGVAMAGVWQQIGPRFTRWWDQADGAQRFYDAVQQAYLEEVGGLRERPGAVALVRRLQASGVPQCAVSNSARATVHANLNQLGVADCMRAIITLSDVEQPKPAPEPYLRGCAAMGLVPSTVIAVEDSRTGLASARAAGLTAVLLAFEPGWQDWAAGADHVLSSLAEFPALFERLSRNGQ